MKRPADLRKAAQGQMCMVRIPGVCNFNNDTTVLAHLRRAGVGGVGLKPLDMQAVLACSSCHDVLDGRRKVRHFHPLELAAFERDALLRTIEFFLRECPDSVIKYVRSFQ